MLFSSWATAAVWSVACLCHTAAAQNGQGQDLLELGPSLESEKVYIVLQEGPNGESSPSDLRAQGGISLVANPAVASTSQQGQSRDLGILSNVLPSSIWSVEILPILVGGLTNNERTARVRALSRIGLRGVKKQRYWIYELPTAPHILNLHNVTNMALGGIPWSQVQRFTMLSPSMPSIDRLAKRLRKAEDTMNDEEEEQAEEEAERLALSWIDNSDFNQHWTLLSLGATPISDNIFQGDPHQRAQALMRTITSRQRIPDDGHRTWLQELLGWNTDTNSGRDFPLFRDPPPPPVNPRVPRLDYMALQSINWGSIEIPHFIQAAMASGLANGAACMSAIKFLGRDHSSKSKREEPCTHLAELVENKANVPRECQKIRDIEVEIGLAKGYGDGTFDTIGGTIEGSAGKADFFFAEDPDRGTRGVMDINMHKYFGKEEIDIAGINKLTLNAKGEILKMMHNDQFVVQDVAIRANCSDPAFSAQDNKYVGIHRTYKHPGQEGWEFGGEYKKKTVGVLKIDPSQWSFTPPCAYIKDLRYEFHMGTSLGDGTWDTVSFKLGQSKKIKLGTDIEAGTSISGQINLEKTFDRSVVNVRELNKLTLWDDLAEKNWVAKGDEWKFQGMTFTASCAAIPRRVTMRKFAFEGEDLQYKGSDQPVWSGEITPRNWREVA